MIENKEKPIFAAVIRSPQISQEDKSWKIEVINNGVLIETVIMQLKALIRNYQSNYFYDFDSKIKK